MTEFSGDFSRLGDPHIINVPPNIIEEGEKNHFELEVGSSPSNTTNCSEDNSIIYKGMIDLLNASSPYSDVLPEAEGCTWQIENYKEEITTLKVPADYDDEQECYHTSSSYGPDYYNQDDSYDVAMYDLLDYMDYNNNGRVFMDFEEDDLSINIKTIDHIPYLWGPAVAEVRVWR